MRGRFSQLTGQRASKVALIADGLRWLSVSTFTMLLVLGIGTAILIVQMRSKIDSLHLVDSLTDEYLQFSEVLGGELSANGAETNLRANHYTGSIDAFLIELERTDADAETVAAAREAVAEFSATLSAINASTAQVAERTESVRSLLNRMKAVFSGWSQTLQTQSIEASRAGRSLEQQSNQLNQEFASLSKAVLTASSLMAKVKDIAEFNGSETGKRLLLDRLRISLAAFPPPCQTEDQTDPSRLCLPSPNRVHATIGALTTRDPLRQSQNYQTAIWALEAYLRVSEERYAELSQTLEQVFQDTTNAREAMEKASERSTALARLTTAAIQLDGMFRDASLGIGRELPQARGFFIGSLSQLGLRGRAIAKAINVDEAQLRRFEADLYVLERDGDQVLSALEERSQQIDRLERAMAVFDTELAKLTEAARDSAQTVVMGLIGSTIAAILLLGIVSCGLLWGGRKYILDPLDNTLSAVLSLSRGENAEPVNLGKNARGLSELQDALEQLRQWSMQREELVQVTIEQREEIERSMAALSETTSEMQHLARHDALTGLPNRRHADEFLQLFEEIAPGIGSPFTLLHLDLDRFKEVNDTLGHEAGDIVLKRVAKILVEACEEGDKAFRIGGDEFLLVRASLAPKISAQELATRIIDAVNKPIDYAGHECRVGASIGIADGKDANYSGSAALVNADIALYQAKSSGKNRYAEFTEALQKQTVDRQSRLNQIITAIEKEEFVPYYQPQFYGKTMALHGVEVLCRWHHPELGCLTPPFFMELAEDTSLSNDIDQILLRKVYEEMAYLRGLGHVVPKVSFNMTANRLMQPNLAVDLLSIADKNTAVAVELLESMSLDNPSHAVQMAIDNLKDHGIAIEIDDFGSCRASLAGLIAVAPDAMKIDGSLVAPITTSAQHLRLVRAIIDIGSTLGIDVVAERVETLEHARILTDEGCTVLQGFALAKPMVIDDLVELLSARSQSDQLSA